jgi:hypothetical protein
MERDGLWGTFEALETGDAILPPVFPWIRFWNCTHRALLDTLEAMGTILCDKPFQYSNTRHNRKESPQRTEVSAPEPFPDNPQSQDNDKKEKDHKVDLE